MMENDLISIIIPVYNVENYLKRCVDSVINQTYKNIEILLIDDGSTDNSPQMCDEFKKNDNRILVVHKQNGGLSDARNVGIDICRGNYICFIDSDDFIPKNAIELLYVSLCDFNADISVGGMVDFFDEQYKDNEIVAAYSRGKCYDTEEALQLIMYGFSVTHSASAKLYKKSLFLSIRYPVGKICEDLATTYKVFSVANKIVIFDDVVYYYYRNNNESIMHKTYSKRNLHAVQFAIQEYHFIKDNYINIVDSAVYRVFIECMYVLNIMSYNSEYRKKTYNILKKCRNRVLKDKNIYLKHKLFCSFSLFGFLGIKTAFKIRRVIKQ